MQIENRWKDYIDDQTLNLLGKSIERKIRSSVPRGAFLPNEARKYEVVKKINKYGKAIFSFIEHEGLENSRSTAPKFYDNVDSFYFDVFLNLIETEKIVILSYLDPLDEFKSMKSDEWIDLLKFLNFKDNGTYEKELENCMKKMQKLAEEKRLVRKMIQGRIETWEKIAVFMNRSVPTVMKMALDEDDPLPVSIIGGTATSTEELLSDYIERRFLKYPYYKTKNRRNGKKNKK